MLKFQHHLGAGSGKCPDYLAGLLKVPTPIPKHHPSKGKAKVLTSAENLCLNKEKERMKQEKERQREKKKKEREEKRQERERNKRETEEKKQREREEKKREREKKKQEREERRRRILEKSKGSLLCYSIGVLRSSSLDFFLLYHYGVEH